MHLMESKLKQLKAKKDAEEARKKAKAAAAAAAAGDASKAAAAMQVTNPRGTPVELCHRRANWRCAARHGRLRCEGRRSIAREGKAARRHPPPPPPANTR